MTWIVRCGAFCMVLGAVACTGNPKPLPPNQANDAYVPPQDANMMADGSVSHDANGSHDAMTTDAGVHDGGDDGGVDGGVDGGADASADGGADGSAGDAGDGDGGGPDAGRPHLDAGPFVPDATVNRKDAGPILPPPRD